MALGGGAAMIAHPEHDCQDRWLVDSGAGIAAVFDGMGGHEGAAEAAELARVSLERRLSQLAEKSPEAAIELMQELRGELQAARMTRPYMLKADATAVIALCDEQQITVAWAGDARAYLIDADQELHLLSEDHSAWRDEVPGFYRDEVALALETSVSREQAAERSSWAEVAWLRRNVVRSALAQGPIDALSGPLEPGDRVLLCSDGVHDNLTHQELQKLVSATDPAQLAETVAQAAYRRSQSEHGRAKPDDITCVVL